MDQLNSEMVETPTVKAWVEDGICRYQIKEGVEETYEIAKRDLDASKHLLKPDSSNLLLVDLSGVKSMTKKARDFHSGSETEVYTKAAALIIKSPISRVIGNFFIGLNKPKFPTKLFTSEKEAIEWLNQFRG